MTRSKQTLGPDELSRHILHKYVPQLDFYMGSEYRKIVKSCLDGHIGGMGLMTSTKDFDSGVESSTKQSSRTATLLTVEEQLADCAVGRPEFG